MKLLVLHHEPSWWVWLVTALLLAVGLAGEPAGFAAAIVVSLLQAGYHFVRAHRSVRSFPVQIRLGYAALLVACLLPSMHWLCWLPAAGDNRVSPVRLLPDGPPAFPRGVESD